MLRLRFLAIIGLIICVIPIQLYAVDTAQPKAQAFLSESVFTFQPVVEGKQVVHEFIIHNKVDASLSILDIKSG